jgi:hypothetical protein
MPPAYTNSAMKLNGENGLAGFSATFAGGPNPTGDKLTQLQ